MSRVGAAAEGEALGDIIPTRLGAGASREGLNANERMVLSLIDDRVSVAELGELIGADQLMLGAVLRRLASLGLVSLGGAAPQVGGLERYVGDLLEASAALGDRPLLRARDAAGHKAASASGAAAEGPRAGQGQASPSRGGAPDPQAPKGAASNGAASSAAGPPAAEQLEAPDLTLALQREFDEVAERVRSSDPYVVLGCELGADRDIVRATYFAAIRRYHPDRYFGKRIGSYKATLEKIFRRLTAAHEVLLEQAPERPRERDARASGPPTASTPPQRSTQAERAPQSAERAPQSAERAPQSAESAPRSAESAPGSAKSAPGSAESTRREPVEAPRDASKSASPVTVVPRAPSGARSAARLRSLSRLLADPKRAATRPAPRSSAPPERTAREAAREALIRFRAEHATDQRHSVRRFISAADRAEEAGDLLTARNMLRIVTELCPGDAKLESRLTRVEREAAVKYSDEYVTRGQQAERQGDLVEAARFYELAAAGRDVPAPLLQRAVTCLIQDGRELSRAIRVAKAAVALSPDKAAERSLLARVFLTAGMRQSAVSELARARELDPNEAGVVALSKELGAR